MNPGADGAPHGALSPIADLGLELPQPWPTAAGLVRRVGGAMTSSSSGDNAEDPRTPLGLGERRLGEPEPDPDVSPAGRAIGAMGRATGPGSPTDARLLEPGGSIGGGEFNEFGGIFEGGPIGAEAGGIPRKLGSNCGPAPKFRGTAEGARGGGPCGMEGPGPNIPKGGPGPNGTLGDIPCGGNMPGGPG